MENKRNPEKGYIVYVPPANHPQDQGTSIGAPVSSYLPPNVEKEIHPSYLKFVEKIPGIKILQDPRPKPPEEALPEVPKEAPEEPEAPPEAPKKGKGK